MTKPKVGREGRQIGRRLRDLREFLNLTLREAAKACELTTVVYGEIERGKRTPALPRMQSMAGSLFRASVELERDAAVHDPNDLRHLFNPN